MNELGELNLVEQRKIYLEQLRRQVNLAFKNRYIGDWVKDRNSKEEIFSNEIKETSDDDVHDFEIYKHKKYQVITSNSHDYRDLLIMAYETVYREAGHVFDIDNIDQRILVETNLEHEYKHAVPGLGQKEGKISYSVIFGQIGNKIQLIPGILMEGKFKAGTIKDMLTTPNRLSHSDKAIITNMSQRGK